MAYFINIKLANREKNLLISCGIFLLAVIVSQFLVMPWFAERDRLIAGIASREKDVQEMILMQRKLTAAKENTSGVAANLRLRPKKFALFSYLEKTADTNRVKKFITYMKPSASNSKGPLNESLVEMKLAGVGLESLINYLKEIESPENVVYLKRLSIQSSKKQEGTLDVVIQVLTYSNDDDNP